MPVNVAGPTLKLQLNTCRKGPPVQDPRSRVIGDETNCDIITNETGADDIPDDLASVRCTRPMGEKG